MEIQNRLCEQSLQYTEALVGLASRKEELLELCDVSEYCSQLKEKIQYNSSTFFKQEMDAGILMDEWLFQSGASTDQEVKGLLLRMLDQMWQEETNPENQMRIICTLGEEADYAYNMDSYTRERRKILSKIYNPMIYAKIMPSCFLNSVFADDIADEMQNIKDFSLHTKELTHNLSVLNDEAMILLENCSNDTNLAMKALSSKLMKCSPDPDHQKELQYEFSYESEEFGKRVVKKKKVTCHPHLKLIKKNSDFRIYFAWKDSDVGNEEKVLVGRIGRHGW